MLGFQELFGEKRLLEAPFRLLRTSMTLKIWAQIWQSDSLPKINDFYWVMIHGKLLTVENLQIRGIAGPSRCVLCKEDYESTHNIIFECTFSKKVCEFLYRDLQN
jgi:hypothetical protein